jgi:hypothetical protein
VNSRVIFFLRHTCSVSYMLYVLTEYSNTALCVFSDFIGSSYLYMKF